MSSESIRNIISVNEEGFYQLPSNNSWNYKCNWAVQFLLVVLLSFICFLFSFFVYGTILLIGCFFVVYKCPGILLAIPSAIITYFSRTEEFLPLDTFFPSYTSFEREFSDLKFEVSKMLETTQSGNDLILTRDTYGGTNAKIGKDVKIQDGKTTGWRVLNIKLGNRFSPYAKHFPTLRRLLTETKDVMACVISVLEPGVTIR